MAKREHSKGKHVADNIGSKKHNTSSWMAIIVVLIIIVCGVLVYVFRGSVLNVFANLQKTPITNSLNENINQELINNESTVKKVENSDVLEASNFKIDTSNPNQIEISLILENISSDNISNFYLAISLLDSSGNNVVIFDTYVDKISANSTNTININTKENLSSVVDFKVTKK